MNYKEVSILSENTGNNAFAWQKREEFYGKSPTLIIPSLIEGTLEDVRLGEAIVFEEEENGILRSCLGLNHFVQISIPKTINLSDYPAIQPITIFDNHNHALYFWIDAIRKGIIKKGCELIHIDEHSDLWKNDHILDLDRAIEDEEYAWEFTNLSCNVGNYIAPLLQTGFVGKMIRIENEFQMDDVENYIPSKNSILNIDLDIFSDELDHIPEEKKLYIIKNLLKHVSYVTIATSPYFIDQGKALQKLSHIIKKG